MRSLKAQLGENTLQIFRNNYHIYTFAQNVIDNRIYCARTVFDLISEHALISKHPLFSSSFFNFFFERDPVIIISGPSHATTVGSSVLHPG